jgi:surface protein
MKNVKELNEISKLSSFEYVELDGNLEFVNYVGDEASVVIPGHFNGKRVLITKEFLLKLGKTNLTELVFTEKDDVKALFVSNNLISVFENSKFEKIDLTGLDTSRVTSMSMMFSNCKNLTSLDLSNLNTSKVTNMEYMFSNCTSLTDLDLSSFYTSNVTDMDSMFYNCSSLTNLDIKDFNTSRLTPLHE